MKTRFDFEDAVVLVTGGTSGIGAGVASAFQAAGARVIAAGLETGLDVTSAESIATLLGGLNRLDVLVNAAGIIRRGDEHDPEVFSAVLDVNLTGAMRMCSACLPLLAANGGSVVNIASVLSFFGGGLVPGYSASKGGIVQLTKSLAIAWAGQGIRVNAVAPGWIETPLTAALREDALRSQAILARTPMGRWGTPGDIAGPVLFLASDAAAFVTGAVLAADGGYLVA